MKNILISAWLFAIPCLAIWGNENWLIPTMDPRNEVLLEAALLAGKAGIFEDFPVTAQAVLDSFPDNKKIVSELIQPQPFIGLHSTVSFGGFYDGFDRDYRYSSNEGDHWDFRRMYFLDELPPAFDIGFLLNSGPLAMLFLPELRHAHAEYLEVNTQLTWPTKFWDIDQNFPRRGYVNFYEPPFEMRIARERTHSGPGEWSSLAINRNLPYVDHIRSRFFVEGFEFVHYIGRLSSHIKSGQANDFDTNSTNILDYTLNGEKIDPVSQKHVTVNKFRFWPADFISIGVAEYLVVGGRVPQLIDFLPFNILHNNYAEGWANSLMTLTIQYVPFPGIQFRGEATSDDISNSFFGDEIDTYKPTALGFQLGATILSTPYFDSGPGRLRLDVEWSYTDPWMYNRWYDLWKYTSRFVWRGKPGNARILVDYPLGFYLGPDTVDLQTRLSYGEAGSWRFFVRHQITGKGSINYYGYGDGSLYSKTGNNGFPLQGAPSSRPGIPVEWTNTIGAGGRWYFMKDLRMDSELNLFFITNEHNTPGENNFRQRYTAFVVWEYSVP